MPSVEMADMDDETGGNLLTRSNSGKGLTQLQVVLVIVVPILLALFGVVIIIAVTVPNRYQLLSLLKDSENEA